MSAAPSPRPSAEALARAFAALARYDRGADRGALLPLDEAAAAATGDSALRAELEAGLVRLLRGPASTTAKEYACEKLAMIGGPACVETLAALLAEPDLAHAALNALRAIPGEAATGALRRSLDQPVGPALVGVITALGQRRDAASVEALSALISRADPQVASAAAWALGEIGTPVAGRALRNFLPGAPAAVRPALADACLACARHLRDPGETRAARALLDALLAANPPFHVRAAALRLLASLAP